MNEGTKSADLKRVCAFALKLKYLERLLENEKYAEI